MVRRGEAVREGSRVKAGQHARQVGGVCRSVPPTPSQLDGPEASSSCAAAVSTALNLPRYSMSRYSARTSSRRAATARGDMSISFRVIICGALEPGEIDEILRTPGDPLHRSKSLTRYYRHPTLARVQCRAGRPDLLQLGIDHDQIER